MVRVSLWITIASLTWASLAAADGATTNRPENAWLELKQAYEQKSIDRLGALLTDDYRFHSAAYQPAAFAAGYTRDSELRSIKGLMLGSKHANGYVMAPAETLWFEHGAVSVSDDPEHADSTEQYKTVHVAAMSFHVNKADGNKMWTPSGLHIFHVVRGDAAVLAEGQTADPARWYVRRWLENLDDASKALAAIQGECGEKFAATTTDAPRSRMLGIRALTNPACARLELMLDLPGTESVNLQVLDVTGRVHNTREIRVARAGELKVDAGQGANLSPGVYWVRVKQGDRKPSTRMVVVAK